MERKANEVYTPCKKSDQILDSAIYLLCECLTFERHHRRERESESEYGKSTKRRADRNLSTLRQPRAQQKTPPSQIILAPRCSRRDDTRRVSESRLGHGSPASSGPGRSKIPLGLPAMYEHVLNGSLEWRSMATMDLVNVVLVRELGGRRWMGGR